MKLWKLGTALSLTAAFGLLACGDDSSGGTAASDDLGYTCDITDTKAVVKQNAGDYSVTMTHMIDDKGVLTVKYEYGPGYTDVCNGPEVAALTADAEDADASCEDNTLTIVTKEATTAEEFKEYLAAVTTVCEDPVKQSAEPASTDDDTEGDGEADPTSSDSESTDPASSSDEAAPASSADEDAVSSSSVDWGALTETCTDGATTELMGVTMVCQDGEWVSDIPECTAANEGATAEIAGVAMICSDGDWEPDMPECTAENVGATMTQEAMGMPLELKCTEDGWVEVPCTDGATANVMGMSMVCKSGEWEPDMPECTAENEGATTELMGMSMVCKSGEWEMDMSSFGM